MSDDWPKPARARPKFYTDGELRFEFRTAKTHDERVRVARIARKQNNSTLYLTCQLCLVRCLLACWDVHTDRCETLALIADKGLQEIEQWLETR